MRSALVRSAARSDRCYHDQPGVLVDPDERSPVADAQTPLVPPCPKSTDVAGWQALDRSDDPLLFVAGQLAQRLGRSRRDDCLPIGQLRRQVPAPGGARSP